METRVLIFFNLLLVPSIFGHEAMKCREVDEGFDICEKDNALVYVNQSTIEHRLSINGFKLTSIAPNAFQNLSIKHLRLVFHGNPVMLKPESFEGLQQLQTLVISSAIISLEENMFKALQSLTHLYLTGCNLVEFRKGAFAGLPNLEVLRLKSNISTINTDTFHGMNSNILALSLRSSRISVLEPNSFQRFTNLKSLDLSGNQLTDLESGVFHGLNQLYYLYLMQNQLTIIRRNVFNNLKNVDSIDLSDNRISAIEVGAFAGVNMEILNLERNQLTDDSSGSFGGALISKIQLTGNYNITDKNQFRSGNIRRIDYKYGE